MYFLLFFGILATLIAFLSPIFLVFKFGSAANREAKHSGLNAYFPVAWAVISGLIVAFFIVIVYFAFVRALRINPEPMVCVFFSGELNKCTELYGSLPSYLLRR